MLLLGILVYEQRSSSLILEERQEQGRAPSAPCPSLTTHSQYPENREERIYSEAFLSMYAFIVLGYWRKRYNLKGKRSLLKGFNSVTFLRTHIYVFIPVVFRVSFLEDRGGLSGLEASGQ